MFNKYLQSTIRDITVHENSTNICYKNRIRNAFKKGISQSPRYCISISGEMVAISLFINYFDIFICKYAYKYNDICTS